MLELMTHQGVRNANFASTGQLVVRRPMRRRRSLEVIEKSPDSLREKDW